MWMSLTLDIFPHTVSHILFLPQLEGICNKLPNALPAREIYINFITSVNIPVQFDLYGALSQATSQSSTSLDFTSWRAPGAQELLRKQITFTCVRAARPQAQMLIWVFFHSKRVKGQSEQAAMEIKLGKR